MQTRIVLPYLTIDFSGLRSEFSAYQWPLWCGKVLLTFDNGFGRLDVVTANWSGEENSKEGRLCDFEGESDDESLYEACEVYAELIEDAIISRLEHPSYWDAHQSDIECRKQHGLPPFENWAA